MNKVLLSSVLVGLLSIGSNLIQAEELTSDITFTQNYQTETPTDGVYEVSRGTKTIEFSKEIIKGTIDGGIKVVSGGTVDFNFKGFDTQPKPQSTLIQQLKFGTTGSDDSTMIQTASTNATINFYFENLPDPVLDNTSDRETLLSYSYIVGDYSSAFTIKNVGNMNFKLKNNAKVYFETDILNTKNANMNFTLSGKKSAIHFYSQEGVTKTFTNNGKTIFDFSGVVESDIEGQIINQSDSPTSDSEKATIEFKFFNSREVFFW